MATPTRTKAPSKATTSKKSLEVQTSGEGEIIAFAQEGMPQLEVWLEDETIWLTQQQMARLFEVRENTITYHIKEVVSSGELDGIPTTRKIRVVRQINRRKIGFDTTEGGAE